jgi:hypothetical protein
MAIALAFLRSIRIFLKRRERRGHREKEENRSCSSLHSLRSLRFKKKTAPYQGTQNAPREPEASRTSLPVLPIFPVTQEPVSNSMRETKVLQGTISGTSFCRGSTMNERPTDIHSDTAGDGPQDHRPQPAATPTPTVDLPSAGAAAGGGGTVDFVDRDATRSKLIRPPASAASPGAETVDQRGAPDTAHPATPQGTVEFVEGSSVPEQAARPPGVGTVDFVDSGDARKTAGPGARRQGPSPERVVGNYDIRCSQDRRLRPGQVAGGRFRSCADRHHCGDAQLHGPRTGQRPRPRDRPADIYALGAILSDLHGLLVTTSR